MAKDYVGETCSVEGCVKTKRYAKTGYCGMHHGRAYRDRKGLSLASRYPHPYAQPCSYDAVHVQLRRKRGSASNYRCVGCGEAAQEWSYQGGSEWEQTQERDGFELKYTRDPDFYVARCKVCHARWDRNLRDPI